MSKGNFHTVSHNKQQALSNSVCVTNEFVTFSGVSLHLELPLVISLCRKNPSVTCQLSPAEMEATDAEVEDLDEAEKTPLYQNEFWMLLRQATALESSRCFTFLWSIRPFVIHSSSQMKREKRQVAFFWSRVDSKYFRWSNTFLLSDPRCNGAGNTLT